MTRCQWMKSSSGRNRSGGERTGCRPANSASRWRMKAAAAPRRPAGASRGVSDGHVASPGRLFTSDGGIRRQPCGRCGSNPAVPSLGTQTRVPSPRRRPAGAAEKYQQRLFAQWCHSVLPGLQVYFATLPCLAATSQRLVAELLKSSDHDVTNKSLAWWNSPENAHCIYRVQSSEKVRDLHLFPNRWNNYHNPFNCPLYN